MNLNKLHDSLRQHEGLSLVPYECTEGHLTIGIGHNLSEGITIKQAYALLDLDIETAISELDKNFPGWKAHTSARQNVLIEMQFNLGAPRLKTFRKMWAALERRDYQAAAEELLDSKWARQVGQRAQTLADQMRAGEFLA